MMCGHLIKKASAKDPPHYVMLLRKTSGDGYVWTVRTTGEPPNGKLAEHLKNVFSFHFFENLFREIYLLFFAQFVREGQKKEWK
jgi:hypothetical protein